MVQQKIVLQNSEILVLSRGLCLLNKNEIYHSRLTRFSKNGMVKHRIVLQNSEILILSRGLCLLIKAGIASEKLDMKCL